MRGGGKKKEKSNKVCICCTHGLENTRTFKCLPQYAHEFDKELRSLPLCATPLQQPDHTCVTLYIQHTVYHTMYSVQYIYNTLYIIQCIVYNIYTTHCISYNV